MIINSAILSGTKTNGGTDHDIYVEASLDDRYVHIREHRYTKESEVALSHGDVKRLYDLVIAVER